MTKLMEWLVAGLAFLGVYFALIFKKVDHKLIDDWMFEIQISPIVLVLLFGVS